MCSFHQEVCMMDWQLTCMWGRSPLQLSGCYQVLSPTGNTQLILPQCSHIYIFSWHISLSLSVSPLSGQNWQKGLIKAIEGMRAEHGDGYLKEWVLEQANLRPPDMKRPWGPRGYPGASMRTAQSDMADSITNMSRPPVDTTAILSMSISRVQHHQLLHQL